MMDANNNAAKSPSTLRSPGRKVTNLTADDIKALLVRSPMAVEEAILRLHERQTPDEQAVRDTKHLNQRGFSAAHARTGSKYAGWIKGMRAQGVAAGKCFRQERHLEKARGIALHYTGQLLEVAMAKAKKASG